jgi:hypothetical protein
MNAPAKAWRELSEPFALLESTGVLGELGGYAEIPAKAPTSRWMEKALVTSFNWDDKVAVGVAGSQAPMSACVSYAGCAAAAIRLSIRKRTVRLAPRVMHLCVMKLDPALGTSATAFIDAARRAGLPEAPTDSEQQSAGLITQGAQCGVSDEFGAVAVLDAYRFTTEEEIKQEIVRNGPVVAHIYLYEDFWTRYGGGIYSDGTVRRGEHAVCLIGFDDAAQCWIGLNSQGPRWGEDGRFRLKYGSCGVLAKYMPVYALKV